MFVLLTACGVAAGGEVRACGNRTVGQARRYDARRMFGAGRAFADGGTTQWLRKIAPQVLRLEDSPLLLDLDLGVIRGPPSLGPPADAREMGIFNPAIVPAPRGLCPRCAHVATLRVDPLHQCDDRSPLLSNSKEKKTYAANAWFKGTAIAVLDAQMRVLGWTWFVNAPGFQIKPAQPAPSRWFAPVGAADSFEPPWTKAVYDVRLANLDDQLFVTCALSRAGPFSPPRRR